MSDLPKTSQAIQTEATRFRSAVSEALLQLIGGDINYLLSAILPVGSTIESMLTEAQFQDIVGDGWVLEDGRDCTGSEYAIVTGFTTVPDRRGLFARMKNHGRSTSTGNAAGEVALGTYQADDFKTHTHTHTGLTGTNGTRDNDGGSDNYNSDPGFGTIGNTGDTVNGGETKPRNITKNFFIRIN